MINIYRIKTKSLISCNHNSLKYSIFVKVKFSNAYRICLWLFGINIFIDYNLIILYIILYPWNINKWILNSAFRNILDGTRFDLRSWLKFFCNFFSVFLNYMKNCWEIKTQNCLLDSISYQLSTMTLMIGIISSGRNRVPTQTHKKRALLIMIKSCKKRLNKNK